MRELESGLTCKTRDVITQTPARWVRTREIVFELGSWCWDPRLRCYIGPLVVATFTLAKTPPLRGKGKGLRIGTRLCGVAADLHVAKREASDRRLQAADRRVENGAREWR